jgi:N-acetylglucosaminyl-diphospho-decaprenol L-rhamnosyltransferase
LPAAILIVNFKVYDEIDRALSSIEPALEPGDEVVVVDHASDAARLDAMARRHPRATFVPVAHNGGFAAGVNLAARHATAPYLMMLNPDAVAIGPVVRVLESWMRDHPDVAVVGPRVLDADGQVQASARRFPTWSTAIAGRSTWLTRHFPDNWLSRWNLPGRTASGPVDVDWLAGSCLMTSRAVFDRLGGFDEAFFLYWEDADFCHRAVRAGGRCVYVPLVAVQHVGGLSAARDPEPAIRAFHRSAYYFYYKHSRALGRALAPFVRAALWARGELLVRQGRRTRRVQGTN